ncbi:MAG: hypothetical protein KKH80_00565 [Candidatus Omnitrophica bacterium]|nr:hypothetical protein [Candidatus Omnitrophota bacterium]MBU1871283.1 hypothetical protein [Candidatus Omnitrophota bacterium]
MPYKRPLFNIIFIIACMNTLGCISPNTNISGIRNLARLGGNDQLKEKALQEETANFLKVKDYIDNKKMEAGLNAKSCIRKFGKPVVITSYPEGEKWIYKQSSVDWIGGEKIYLFFDAQKYLTSWECINCS